MFKINVRQNLSEDVQYNSPNMPIKSCISMLSNFSNYTVDCHWHSELECAIILDGDMSYFINGASYRLSKGMGIIVNSNRLHFGGPINDNDCTFILLMLHPSLLCGIPFIENQYINPFLYDTGSDAIILSEKINWNLNILSYIKSIFYLTQQQPTSYELQIQSQFYSLWTLLYENTVAKNGSHKKKSAYIDTLKDMITYIQTHYAEKISLNDIAAAGAMCRSKCCDLFKETLHQSPFEYLLNYRIQKSIRLLADSSFSIMDISEACGFNGCSYYAEVFHKTTGTTPSEYRKSIPH